MNRRRFLQLSALAALGRLPAWAAPRRELLPVQVSADRLIRTVVGLRPFRPSGFVVRPEKLGEKLVVHNYGHGGGGVTLSWGTAHLAVELAWASGQREFAVLGCGAVGLATARLLQARGARVTIYTRDLPPQTTSNIAGGQWMPAFVSRRSQRTPAFQTQFTAAAHFAYRYYQDLVGEEYGVRWMDNYLLRDSPFDPDGEPAVAGLLPTVDLGPGEHPFQARYVRRFTTMMVEPAHYLRVLTRDVLEFGGRIEVCELVDRQAVAALPEPVVINCTGLGSHALFDDQELNPIRG